MNRRTVVLAASLFVAVRWLTAAGIDPASLVKPLAESWPTYSGDYSGRRFSALTQVTKSNVKNLSLGVVSFSEGVCSSRKDRDMNRRVLLRRQRRSAFFDVLQAPTRIKPVGFGDGFL